MGIANKLKNLPGKIKRLLGQPQDFEEQIYQAIVRKGDTCFDIGANTGDVSLYLSHLAGRQGQVFAFEPVWPVYQSLCAHISWRIRLIRGAPIVPIPQGVSEAEGTHLIHVPNESFGMASLAASDRWAATQGDAKITSYQCSFVSLDAFMSTKRLEPPQFMKIDVEGAELLVFKGAQNLLESEQRPLMLIEIFEPWERAFGYSPWDVLSLLKKSGYQFLFACPQGLVEHTPSEKQPFPAGYENGYNTIAFIPNRHTDRIQKLDSLRAGGRGKILPMAPPPQPNRI